jgi:hypothetical protein
MHKNSRSVLCDGTLLTRVKVTLKRPILAQIFPTSHITKEPESAIENRHNVDNLQTVEISTRPTEARQKSDIKS